MPTNISNMVVTLGSVAAIWQRRLLGRRAAVVPHSRLLRDSEEVVPGALPLLAGVMFVTAGAAVVIMILTRIQTAEAEVPPAR